MPSRSVSFCGRVGLLAILGREFPDTHDRGVTDTDMAPTQTVTTLIAPVGTSTATRTRFRSSSGEILPQSENLYFDL